VNRSRILSLTLVFLFVAAGCGQKPGVAPPLAGGLPEGATVNAQGEVVDSSGEVIGTVDDLAGTTGGDLTGATGTTGSGTTGSSTTTGSGTTGSSNTPTGSGTGSNQPSGSESPAPSGPEPSGGDATGVTNDLIKIGSHAPLTGAAPVPSDSAQKGADIYWKWLEHNKESVNGRRVEAILKNDNYNPSQAVAVCKEMVEKDKVFLLSGLAGTDQIQACARYAASVGVPYLSAGVTTNGLDGLPNYFATTMTYADQAPMLADYIINKLGGADEKSGMLRFETPNFEDAHQAFIGAMQDKGAPVAYDRAVPKQAGSTEAQTVVQEMKTAGIENVFVLTSPVWFLQVLQAAKTQQYTPQWVGIGITMTFDTVATVGCRNGTLDKSKFFAPFPAWVDSDKYDPEYRQAVHAIYPDNNPQKRDGDDFVWLGYASSKGLASMLALPGKDLTRERFVYFLERARNLKTGILPPNSFTPDDHFGADQVHVNEAQCSVDNRWHTIQSFVSDF
jgi:ABC-type branched-subunit amino acid transport system substrate-binding protein